MILKALFCFRLLLFCVVHFCIFRAWTQVTAYSLIRMMRATSLPSQNVTQKQLLSGSLPMGYVQLLPEGSLTAGSNQDSPEFENMLCYLGHGNQMYLYLKASVFSSFLKKKKKNNNPFSISWLLRLVYHVKYLVQCLTHGRCFILSFTYMYLLMGRSNIIIPGSI